MDNTTSLPTRIINHKKRNEFKKELEHRLDAVQSAYNAVRAMEDLGEIPTDPKHITPKWLNEVLQEQVSSVIDLPLPSAKKNEILDMWERISKQSRQYITIIQDFFESFKEIKYQVIDGAIIITNIDAILDSKSIMSVPEDAQKHYELWRAVRDAIKALRDWEQSKNLKKFPMDEIINSGVDAIQFAEHWCEGTFIKSELEKSPRAEAIRKANESLYL